MYKLENSNYPAMEFEIFDGVFSPTGTTLALLDSLKGLKNIKGKLLDLGCGCGVVGITAIHAKLGFEKAYASDLSSSAVECAEVNASNYNCQLDFKTGSLFKPWDGHKFDVIVDDVSGIAQEIAQLSPWFSGVPCESGEDGTSLVRQVIKDSPRYLNDGGSLIFPVISLSNGNAILSEARNVFSSVKKIHEQEWPLPKELDNSKELLDQMSKEGNIQIENRFGINIFKTEIYIANNAKEIGL